MYARCYSTGLPVHAPSLLAGLVLGMRLAPCIWSLLVVRFVTTILSSPILPIGLRRELARATGTLISPLLFPQIPMKRWKFSDDVCWRPGLTAFQPLVGLAGSARKWVLVMQGCLSPMKAVSLALGPRHFINWSTVEDHVRVLEGILDRRTQGNRPRCATVATAICTRLARSITEEQSSHIYLRCPFLAPSQPREGKRRGGKGIMIREKTAG